MLNIAVVESIKQVRPVNGLEAWFKAMGQTDFARMDEDKPLVHEVNTIIRSEYRITPKGIFVVHEDEQMRQSMRPPVIVLN